MTPVDLSALDALYNNQYRTDAADFDPDGKRFLSAMRSFYPALAAEILKLREERVALGRDAKRYRWLRAIPHEKMLLGLKMSSLWDLILDVNFTYGPDDVDHTIDAAITEGEQQ